MNWLRWICLVVVWPTSGLAQELAQDATKAEIVILGEVHDNPDAHLGQAAMIRALKPTAVVFEMLSPEAGVKANANRDSIAQVTDWANSGWPDFALYQPIFDALGKAQIIGAAAPGPTVRAAFSKGALAVFGADAARFGLDTALDPAEQTLREDLQFAAHCKAMPREMMSGMVEAQRFRDATFAKAALDAFKAHGAPVVVIVGNGHARTDWGVPAMIRKAAPTIRVFAQGFVEGATDMPFDAVTSVPAPERGDPCAAF